MGTRASISWEVYFVDIVLMTARDPEDGVLLFAATDRDMLLDMAVAPIEPLASVARPTESSRVTRGCSVPVTAH